MCVAPCVFVDARRRDALGQVVSGGSESEQLLGALDVGLGQLGRARHATGHLRRLLLQVVAQTGLLAADLAGAGHAEALGGAAVRLVLGHLDSFYSLRFDLGVEVLGALALLLGPGCGVGGAALGVLLGPLGLASGCTLFLLRLHLGLGLGLLLVRPQD